MTLAMDVYDELIDKEQASITKDSPIDDIIQLYNIIYEWSHKELSSDIYDPSSFTIFIIDQLLSMDTDERKLLVLDIIKRLRITNDMLNNTWKKNSHLIVVKMLSLFDIVRFHRL